MKNDVLRSKGPNFSKLRRLALDPRKNMPHIEAEVSFVISYRNGSVTKMEQWTREEEMDVYERRG
jgi:hypothetical protein